MSLMRVILIDHVHLNNIMIRFKVGRANSHDNTGKTGDWYGWFWRRTTHMCLYHLTAVPCTFLYHIPEHAE